MCVPILYLNAKKLTFVFSALLRNALRMLHITNVTILQVEASRKADGVRVKIVVVFNGLFLQIPLQK